MLLDFAHADAFQKRLCGRPGESGVALFMVLWVLILLSVIVGEFCHAMRTEVNITRNFKDETQAYYIAEAGLYRAVAELIRDEVLTGRLKSAKSEEEDGEIRWRVNAAIPVMEYGQGRYRVEIGNESGKVNINKAGPKLLSMMLNGLNLEDDHREVIVDSIRDWRDKDYFHRVNGAEDDYYLSLPEPYECRDSDFESVEELLLVRGMTPEIFYGGLSEMVTVYQDEEIESVEAGVQGEGFDFDRININAASPRMLLALPRMTEDIVRDIMLYREEKDFKSLMDVRVFLGSDIYGAIRLYITIETLPFYAIRSVGEIGGTRTKRAVRCLVQIGRDLKKGYRMIQWMDG